MGFLRWFITHGANTDEPGHPDLRLHSLLLLPNTALAPIVALLFFTVQCGRAGGLAVDLDGALH